MKAVMKVAMVAGLLLAGAASGAQKVDEESGLIIAPNWETVKANCTACHSAKLITGQRGSRETWEGIIRWMQKTQGLWQYEPQVESDILDYLAANYPPGDSFRRSPIPPQLMPPQ